MEDIKNKLTQFTEYKGISKREFCRKIEVSPTFLANNSSITIDKVIKILTVYPEINIYWLIMGRGEMIVDSSPEYIQGLASEYATQVVGIQQKMDKLGYFDADQPAAATSTNENRLWSLIESQEQTIKSLRETLAKQTQTIADLTKKGDAAGVPGVASMGAKRAK